MIPYTLIAPIVIEMLALVAAHAFAMTTRLTPRPGSTATITAGSAIAFAVVAYEATRYYFFGESVSTSLCVGALIALVASIVASYGIDWLGILTDPKLQHQKAR